MTRSLSQQEIDDLDDLQRMVWEAYGRKLPTNEAGRLIEEKRAEARRELVVRFQHLPLRHAREQTFGS